LYEETLVHKRWRLDNYKACHVALNSAAESSSASNETSVIVSTNKIHQPQPKTQHQKYNAAQLLALRIAAVISETGIREFNSKMNVLKNILQHWENGMSVCVTGIDTAAADEFIEQQISDCEDTREHLHEENADDGFETESNYSEHDEDESSTLTTEIVELPEHLQNEVTEPIQEIIVDEGGQFEEIIDDDDYNEAVRCVAQEENNFLSFVKLPPKMRKRGQPKGLANTVIGLPRKKAKSGPVAFEKMLPPQKDIIILSWFVGKDAAEEAIKGKIITEDVVETIPENVNNACVDECVCMQSVKRFFTHDAWKTVEDVLKFKREGCSYYCSICELEIDDGQDESINCSSCLGWLHFKCTGLRSTPKKKYWFCRACSTFTLNT